MNNYFIKSLENNQNKRAYTENGARTNRSTKSALVDFFGLGGALRDRSGKDVISLFTKALSENKLLALKILFYLRDIRGGQGEKRTFRAIFNYLCNHYLDIVNKNLKNIPVFGRWDDFYCAVNTKSEKNVFKYIESQLFSDASSETPSLLAKWLKSENASSKETKILARKTREFLGFTSKEYRKILSKLRKKIDIVESLMSSGKWSSINYEHVPSRASMIYSKAFRKHNEIKYQEYIDEVTSGKKKINTKTLYPYDIVNKILYDNRDADLEVLSALWNNLPNYVEGNENALVMADVSGSMNGLPMAISISLAMYFAERNTGVYKDYFMTFSTNPELVKIQGSNIYEKVRNISRANWKMSTSIRKAFDRVLSVAIENRISSNEMPKKFYIISDMEFDSAVSGNRKITNYDSIKREFKNAGYTMPQIVFWNVNARNNQSPITIDDKGVCLVSGSSPVIFKNLMNSKEMSPYDVMLDVINQERYDSVVV